MVTTTERIQLNRKTAAQWTAQNPVLLAGEAGVELDTGRAKFGNGTTAWNSLPYSGSTGTGAVSSVAGRTGDVTLTKTDVGLGSVDNTADTAKPVSTAQAAAIAAKADYPTGGVNGQALVKSGTTTAWATLGGSGTAADVFYPEAYGAKADGVTDDTTALQAAINAAGTYTASSAVGLVGVVPLRGLYKVSSTISVTRSAGILGVHQTGSGIIAAAAFTGTRVLDINAPSGSIQVLLDGFSVTDPGTTNTVVNLTGVSRGQVNNLLITGGADGLILRGCIDVKLTNNLIRTSVNAGIGFRGTVSTHVQSTGNRIRDALYAYFLEAAGMATQFSYTGDDIVNGGLGANLTNNRTWLATAVGSVTESGRVIVTGDAAESALTLMEPGGVKTHIRRGTFALEFLNSTYTTVIGALSNGGTLNLTGAVQLASSTAPSAAASEVGSIRYKAGGPGVADIIQVCVKSAADTYSWKTIVTG